jgi:hypothetical protein
MNVINELLRDIPIPKMVKVKQKFHAPELEDVAESVWKAIQSADVLKRIDRGWEPRCCETAVHCKRDGECR